METQYLIAAQDFCIIHHIELSFIWSLEEAGLLQLVDLDEQKFIEHHQLGQLEKIIRLTRDLDINIAGVEVIINLLQRMEEMQNELNTVRNKLSFYEEK